MMARQLWNLPTFMEKRERNKSRFALLAEARGRAQKYGCDMHIILLPPNTGDANVPTDDEDSYRENLVKSAGKLEVVQSHNDDDAYEPEDKNQPIEAKRRVIWRKDHFIKKMEVFESEPMELEEEYSLLIDKSLFEL